ncbi:MAG: hypothetical protein MJ164_02575 [Alphaproteobacteria bacterium]|nr:hypothetical protein [Alphaproteobacteria bacterium]
MEYIESTGTQYIDTREYATNNTKVELKCAINNYSNASCPFGARQDSTHLAFNVFVMSNTRNLRWDLTSSTPSQITDGVLDTTTPSVLIKDGKDNYLNGTKLKSNSEVGNFTTDRTLYLFALHGGPGPEQYFKGKIYYGKLWDNEILVHNFLPARRDSDNTVGMYDAAWNGSQYGVVDLGNLDWTLVSSGQFFYTTYNNIKNGERAGSVINNGYLANSDYAISSVYNLTVDKTYCIYQTNSGDIQIRIKNNSYIDTASFKQAMSGVKLYYQRTTDTEFHGPFYTNSGADTFVAGPVAHCKTFGTNGATCTECKTDYILNNGGGCSEKIKIATTKFVDDEFKAAEDQLATTVQTIENVVSRTIAQTGQIQILQDTKQTRPDESCPANMKCLLVQDEDGTPHWYPIIEP